MVEFMGNRNDIPEILATSDVFVLSSNSECCPMTVLEAMASELPIVSTDVGGVKELVGEAGILSSANDINGFAKAMVEMITNRAKMLDMGIQAKRNASRFNSVIIANEYCKLYENTDLRRNQNNAKCE